MGRQLKNLWICLPRMDNMLQVDWYDWGQQQHHWIRTYCNWDFCWSYHWVWKHIGIFCVLVREESFMYLKQGYLDIIGCIWIEEEETEKLEKRKSENRKDNVWTIIPFERLIGFSYYWFHYRGHRKYYTMHTLFISNKYIFIEINLLEGCLYLENSEIWKYLVPMFGQRHIVNRSTDFRILKFATEQTPDLSRTSVYLESNSTLSVTGSSNSTKDNCFYDKNPKQWPILFVPKRYFILLIIQFHALWYINCIDSPDIRWDTIIQSLVSLQQH